MPEFGFCRKPIYRNDEQFAYKMGPLRLSVKVLLPCPIWLMDIIMRYQDRRRERAHALGRQYGQ